MNSFYLVMIQTSNSSPEGILGDELGTNLIYETRFCLRGRFWLGIKLRCQVFYLGIIQTPNSFSEQFPGDELGTNLIYRPNQTRICWSRPFCLGMKLKCLVSNLGMIQTPVSSPEGIPWNEHYSQAKLCQALTGRTFLQRNKIEIPNF